MVAFCFITERQIHFFMNVYFSPNPLYIGSIIFADMLINKRGSFLYQVTFKGIIVP